MTAPKLPSASWNVASNWVWFFGSSLVAFFLAPFVVHHLGNSAYGIWLLISSLAAYLSLLNVGVGNAVVRYVAQFHAEGNDKDATAVASSALAICLAAGTVAIIVCLILARFVVGRFHIFEAYQSAARIIIILGGFSVAVSMISGVFSGIVAGLYRFDWFNVVALANTLLSSATIVLVLNAGKGLVSVAIVYLCFAVATGLIYARVAFRLYPALKIRLSKSDMKHVKLIFSFSAYVSLLQVSSLIIYYTDSLVIGTFLSVSLITFFAIAGNLVIYSQRLIAGISTLMTPRASALSVTGIRGEMQSLLVRSTRIATVIILPVALTFLLRGSSFIGLWMGQRYAESSGRVLSILTLALIFAAADQVATSTMIGIGKHRVVVFVVLSEALCNIALSIVLARPMGIFGVAWGTTLPSLLVSLFFWPWYVNQTLGIPIRKYIISTWLWPTIAVIPFGLLTYGIEKLWPAPNLAVFFFQTGIVSATAIVASWYLCFDYSERQTYTQRLAVPISKVLEWI